VRRIGALALLATLAMAGCETGGTHAPAPSATPSGSVAAALATPAGAVLSADEVARLTALGYVDVSEDAVEADQMGVVLRDPERSQPGYNLFTNAHLCSTQIVDADGAVVHQWSHTPCFRWDNTVLLPAAPRW